MNKIILPLLLSACVFIFFSCEGQNENSSIVVVGGPFENREWTYDGMPDVTNATDTSACWKQEGPKLLLTGTVYHADGRTPATGVLLYYYHTNTEGRYVHKAEVPGSMAPNHLGQTHGYIRGWVKTDQNGRYSIYTVRPGVYPTRDEPAHVHVTVKEPNEISEYYLDSFVFDDDELLTSKERNKLSNRGGSGVVRLVEQDGLLIGERDIILGLNIPDYPDKKISVRHSGKAIGEDVSSFMPFHAWGPDRGTRTCPVCKYGWYHGVLYFVGNQPHWTDIKQWLQFLEAESKVREKYLKVYFIYGNEENYEKSRREEELADVGRELGLKYVALTFVPSFRDSESEINLIRIDPDAQNTFLIYKRSRVIASFVNLKAGEESFQEVRRTLDESINDYFKFAKPDFRKQ